ncbi:hypothetical protein AAVH_43705, partial [Aphelenchoides avenae]
PDVVEKYLRLLHYFGAVFRLSFRHPERMHFEDEDRDLVIDYLGGTFEDNREPVEKGELSPKQQTNAESLVRILEQKRAKQDQEL